MEHNRSPKTDKAKERTPWLAFDLTFRPPPTAHIAWALMDDRHRRVLELCDDIARDKTLAWMEESVAEIRSKAGGKLRARVKDGLIVAVFRHYESRATESRPLLHAHAIVSIRARRPHDGKWGNLSVDSLMTHIVAADTLYTLYFMEEVSARLGWAWEPREVTPGHRPVTEIAGLDQRLIGWQSTRRQQIEDALPVLTAKYEEKHGHAPGERAAYALACQAADQTRPPKRTELLSLTELRKRWRTSAIRAYGADAVDRLAERARVRPVVDIALAVVDVVAVVYVMRGAFKRHHLLAEARRHLSYVLRGRPHEPGLDERIVQTVVDDYTRPAGRPSDDDRQPVPARHRGPGRAAPLTRRRTAAPYGRARLAADALKVRAQAVRRADRLSFRTRPPTVAVPPPRGRIRGRFTPAGRPAAFRNRRPTSTRLSRPAAPSPRPPSPGSRKAPESVPSPTAPDHSPPQRRPRRRTPSNPAPSTHRAGRQEESREHPGRTAQPRSSPRKRPRGPREDGRRARRGPGARAR
ncbi:MobF family relaxase [Streptomyces albogriseolus]|uniref:MobF family relaxase n=1 Tax=Streptomyces albogriseolus TaxID=1887 RepID=UPI003821FACC